MAWPFRPSLGGRAAILLWMAALAACSGSRSAEKPADERFGHRFEGPAPDGRETVVVATPDTLQDFFYYPASFDTVHIRPGSFREGVQADVQQVPVEVLVKGAFPDACTELDDVEQVRAGHLINMTLTMRRPKGAVCASVVRPYRFYVMLEGLYGLGYYTLKLNNRVFPFEVREPARR